MNNKLTKPFFICVLALLCALLWGSASPCIKIGYKLFQISSEDTMSQILFAGTRFALAGILTVFFGSLLSRKILFPKKDSWKMVFSLSAFQTVIQYVLFYVGLAHAPGVKGAIYSGLSCFFATLISGLIFRMEKITIPKLTGCIIGFLGILVLNLNGSGIGSGFSVLGDGALFFSNLSYAVSSVLIKRYSAYDDPVTLSGYQFTVGGLIMVVISALLGGRLNAAALSAWLLMLYLGFLSATAYTIWSLLLKYNPVSKISAFSFATPIFGVFLSLLLLSETIDIKRCLAALVFVCLGIVLVNRQGKKS